MAEQTSNGRPSAALRKVLVPLALAQFICSFAGSNMNVMINDISKDLDTTVVQSSFGDDLQGEISGLSRCVSNLGSSLGAAIAGTILVAGLTKTPERSYALAMIALAVIGVTGLAAAALLPRTPAPSTALRSSGAPHPRAS
jgi:hypothetical protein